MSDSLPYHSFTAADIERYYKGQMSPSERHALEKAALDDPFLADALEGYVFTPAPQNDIAALQARLEAKVQKKNSIPLFSKKWDWMKVAALFLLLAGGGWLVINNNLFNKRELADAPASEKATTSVPVTTNTKTNKDIETLVDTSKPPAEKQKPQTEVAATKKPERKESESGSVTSALSGKEQDEPAAAPSANNVAANQNNTELTQYSTTNNRAALSNNAQAKAEARAIYKANAAPDKDSAAIASLEERAAGVQAANDTVQNMNIVMKPAKESYDEVIVVGYGKKKETVSRPRPRSQILEPAEGWDNFNEYVIQNLKRPGEANESNLSGEVELSFDITKEGSPTNIKIEKSLCSSCDAEAVRLVKDGPKWKKKKDKKAKIAIHF